MERLTERIDNVPDGESGVWVKNHDYVSAAEKLCEYEDLEENGNLLRLPYKLGDTVYGIFRGKKIVPLKVHSINLTKNGIEMCLENKDYLNYGTITVNANSRRSIFDKYNFGAEWYKTYEEAEESVREALLDKDTDGIER